MWCCVYGVSDQEPPPHLPTPGAHQLISHSLHSLALQDTSQHKTTSISNSAGAASQRLCYSCSSGWIRVVLPPCACFASQDFQREFSVSHNAAALGRAAEGRAEAINRLINSDQSVVFLLLLLPSVGFTLNCCCYLQIHMFSNHFSLYSSLYSSYTQSFAVWTNVDILRAVKTN